MLYLLTLILFKMNKKVAVIIPVYNVEPWIEQCINSVKDQDFDGMECIVIDDASTDKSFEIANDLVAGDSRFQIVRQEHSGLSAARNLGLDLSESELVMYVDSDDYVLPNFVQSAVSFLEENYLQMAFFNGDVINCNSNRCIFYGEQDYINRCGDYGNGSGQEMFCRLMKNDAYVYAVFLQIIRRNCIKHRFYNGIRAQDKLYTTQNLLHLDRVGYFPEILYIKRSHDGSAISSKKGMHILHSKSIIFLEMKRYVKEYGPELSKETLYWIDAMLQRICKDIARFWKKFDADEQRKIDLLPSESKILLQSILETS